MGRVTIDLPEDKYRAIKSAASRRRITVGALVQEGIEAAIGQARREALALRARAGEHSAAAELQLTEDELMALAASEAHQVREVMARER